MDEILDNAAPDHERQDESQYVKDSENRLIDQKKFDDMEDELEPDATGRRRRANMDVYWWVGGMA